MNLQEEFQKAPIQTTAAAIAIAIAVGGIFAGGLNLALPSIRLTEAAWFPVYAIGCAIGVAAGLLASLAFRRTWVFGIGSTIGLFVASANVAGRMLAINGLDLNDVEVFLNGALCFLGFWGALGEKAYLAGKRGGAFRGEEGFIAIHMSTMIATFILMMGGLVFSFVYTGSLPAELVPTTSASPS